MTELIYSDKRAMKVTQIYMTRKEVEAGELMMLMSCTDVSVDKFQEFHHGREFLLTVKMGDLARVAFMNEKKLKQLHLDGPKKSYTIADISALAKG